MALNTVKPTVAAPPRANVPREVVPPAPAPEPVVAPEPEAEPAPAPRPRRAEPERPRSTWSVFTLLERLTRMDGLFREGLPVHYLPHLLFVMFLTLVYIGNTHYAYRMNRTIQKLKLETEDLRADYTTLKSDYMEASKQSEVARRVAPYGLVESSSPPFRINVPAGHLDEAALEQLPVLSADSVAAAAKADSAAMAPQIDSVAQAVVNRPAGVEQKARVATRPAVRRKKAPVKAARPAAKAKPAARTAKSAKKPAKSSTSTHSAPRRDERKR
ncbi:hypothetical protein LJY25_19630 [Hymenobacter sp. BT175]|uniref:FtsL-like putative cell division protein n=1 Tax=Hymenobacter translucens TaxID=2886507 RepID=UPI001D0DC7B3|nr:FtsL-like putative cell division protein [Hymenobacter translucens]MCC2548669.1 hypothetical protein [Hymenobacter translucens]